MGSTLTKVFEPITIKGVEFQNRIICTPHVYGWGNSDGSVGHEQIACYERIAEGRPGLITIGNVSVDMNECRDELGQINLGDDNAVVSLGVMRRRVERYGTQLSAQINYCGRNAWWKNPEAKQYARGQQRRCYWRWPCGY